MIETLQKAGQFSVLAFVVSSIPVVGMSRRRGDVAAPLKSRRIVAVVLAVNSVAAVVVGLFLLLGTARWLRAHETKLNPETIRKRKPQ